MKDPYQILGVAPTATDDEVKSAYRALAKKYHPDKYRDTDLAEMANEKMKEINAAYDEVQKIRAGKSTGQSAYGGGYGGSYGGTYGGQSYGSAHHSGNPYVTARQFINMNRVLEAEQVLSTVPQGDRGAEWQFLMGCVALKRGFFVDAQQYFDTACGMDPDNAEYRNAREHLRNRNAQFGTGRSAGSSCSVCDICTGLLCLDCLCGNGCC